MNLCRNNLKASNQYYKRKSFTQQAYVTDKRISYICSLKCFLTCHEKQVASFHILKNVHEEGLTNGLVCAVNNSA